MEQAAPAAEPCDGQRQPTVKRAFSPRASRCAHGLPIELLADARDVDSRNDFLAPLPG